MKYLVAQSMVLLSDMSCAVDNETDSASQGFQSSTIYESSARKQFYERGPVLWAI